MSQTEQELIQELFSAFSHRARPSPQEGFELPCEEAQALSELFGQLEREEITWKTMRLVYQDDEQACFAMMKLKGILYYLPAIAAISLDMDKTELIHVVIDIFSSYTHKPTLIANMTDAERTAVLHLLEYVDNKYGEGIGHEFLRDPIERLQQL